MERSWLRRAMPIVIAHKFTLGTALLLSFVGLVLQVQIPNYLNEAVSNSLQRHIVPIHHYVVLVLVIALLGGVANYISRLNLMRTAYAIEFDLRNLIYAHLVDMSFQFYDRVQTGQLISRANSDIRSVQMYLTFAPAILVQCAIAVIAFGYMLSINVPLAFVAMITTPGVYFASSKMREVMFPVSWLIQARLAEVSTIVDENINGVRVVKSFAQEEKEVNALARSAERLRWAYVRDADLRAKFTPVVQNLPQIGLALILLYGGYLVIHGEIGVGAILAFTAYIVMLQAPFQMLGMLIMLGQRAAASAKRIYEVVDEQPVVVNSLGAVDLLNPVGAVDFDNVTFSYDADRPVIEELSLHIRPGETVAIVGATGSGKSTVARLIPRFYDVDSGSISVDGNDVRGLTLESLRASIGFVPDEPFLFSTTIAENIAFGRPDASHEEIEVAARLAGASEFIDELAHGYDTIVGERGYTLSGGQRQRISIARALLLNPRIVILDDATSAVDVETENAIHDALRILMEDRTTIIIAHRLSSISLADRVILLDHGKAVAEGTHQHLLASVPLYGEVLAQRSEVPAVDEGAPVVTNGDAEGDR